MGDASDILTPSEIEAMKLRDGGEEAAEAIANHDQPTIDRRKLLRHLHAIGHAAGALSREGEIAALRSEIARWREAFEGATPEEASGAIRDQGAEYRTTIARLTAELAAATERAEIAREMADKCAASEKATLSSWLRAKEEAEATARAEGAHDERERLLDQVGSLSTNRETPAFRSAIADALDAMGEGHKVDESRARGDR